MNDLIHYWSSAKYDYAIKFCLSMKWYVLSHLISIIYLFSKASRINFFIYSPYNYSYWKEVKYTKTSM